MSVLKNKRRSGAALALGLLIVALLLVFKGPIQRQLMLNVALNERSVSAELIEEIASGSGNPVGIYEAFWNSRKIPHRVAALRAFNRGASINHLSEAPRWLYDAAMDADLQVRELSLAILASVDDPKLERIVHAWLLDPDPALKQLALRQARTSGLTNLSHTVASLLEHPEINVRIAAATTFRVWAGEDFGVRMVKLNGIYDKESATYSGEDPIRVREVKEGLEQWNRWWKDVGAEQFAKVPIEPSPGNTDRLPAPGFLLHGLDHKDARLVELRGKPVLLNFWATWCSACWSEIPDLVELNDRLGDRVHIVGISLDGLPDQHEIDHGHSHGDGHEHVAGHEELTELVATFVEKNKMDYRILLDPEGITSELYTGNELPMNVIIDAEGNLHRRFMGTRSLAGFEAILREILPQ